MKEISTKQEGRRLVIDLPYGHPGKERIKAAGAHWDPEARTWWIGISKVDEMRLLIDTVNQETANAEPTKPDTDSLSVAASVIYKGQRYRCIAGSHPTRCRLVSGDSKLDFWVDRELVEVAKTYQSDRRRGLPTVGSLRRFAERAKAEKADPTAERRVCWECGRSFVSSEVSHSDWEDSYCGC